MKNTRKILSVALPATIENLLASLVGFIDAIILAKISLSALNAVGLVNGIMAIFQAIFVAISIAATSLVARNVGANQWGIARQNSYFSTVFAFLSALFLAILSCLFAVPILTFSGANGEILTLAHPFFLLIIASTIPWSMMTTMGGFFRIIGQPNIPMKVSLFVNILNVLLDLFLVFGWVGLPKLGIVGAGLGTFIARSSGLFLLIYFLQRTPLALKRQHSRHSFDVPGFFRLTLPSAMERFAMRIGDVFINRILIQVSFFLFSGFTVFENIAAFTFAPALGISTAVVALVGKEIGSGDIENATQMKKDSEKVAFVVLAATGVLLFFTCVPIARFFTTNGLVLSMIENSVLLQSSGLLVLAFSLVNASALQARGDTFSPMLATSFGMLFLRLPFCFLLCAIFHFELVGVALATIFDNIFRAIFLHRRFTIQLKENL
jgi:putative MATE family efflux protein